MVDFWDVAPCSLVEIYRRFRGAFSLHYQDDDLPETSVNFYDTTLRNIPGDSHLHTRRRENLKSYRKIRRFLSYFRGSVALYTLEHSGTDQIKCILSQLQSARRCYLYLYNYNDVFRYIYRYLYHFIYLKLDKYNRHYMKSYTHFCNHLERN
jgi:hypothetical protein